MTKTSRRILLAGSFALVSTTAFLAAGGNAANAQTPPPYYQPNFQSYQYQPYAPDGYVIDNGQVIGRDPDPNIQFGLKREYDHREGD